MNKIVAVIGIAALSSLFSCSKSGTSKPTGLVVNLRSSALTADNIDSADVVFRKMGTDTRLRQRFVKTAENLVASLRSLSPGTWNADIEVYTKTVNQLSNQYVFIKPLTITEQTNHFEFAGPGTSSGNGWSKRHVKSSAGNEVVVIVPDDVYDPYFEIRAKAGSKLAFGVQREAVNVNHVVDLKTYACANNCLDTTGYFSNNTHFMPFTQTILSSPWTSNDISISVINDKSEMILVYDRTWNK